MFRRLSFDGSLLKSDPQTDYVPQAPDGTCYLRGIEVKVYDGGDELFMQYEADPILEQPSLTQLRTLAKSFWSLWMSTDDIEIRLPPTEQTRILEALGNLCFEVREVFDPLQRDPDSAISRMQAGNLPYVSPRQHTSADWVCNELARMASEFVDEILQEYDRYVI